MVGIDETVVPLEDADDTGAFEVEVEIGIADEEAETVEDCRVTVAVAIGL